MIHNMKNFEQLSTKEIVRLLPRIEKESDEEQYDRREERFIPQRITYEIALTYVEGLIEYRESGVSVN